MAKYRKKPVIIDAYQVSNLRDSQIIAILQELNAEGNVTLSKSPLDDVIIVKTLEGDMAVREGAYIIKGVKGELYPCDPEIFELTYEPVKTDWKERLKTETEELSEKVNKLHDYFKTEAFYKLDRPNKDLLYSQHNYMMGYLQLLGKRCELNNIKLFEGGNKNEG